MSYPLTLLPEYLGIVQATSVNFYNTSTNILDVIGDHLAEVNENIKFEKAKVSTNMLDSFAKLFDELNKTDFTIPNLNKNGEPVGVKQLDDTFKLYFIEKYQSLSADYKTKVNELISGNVYFTNFSDDVGYISDTISVFDNNVNPIYDKSGSLYFYQMNLPVTLFNKVSKNEKRILKTFSYYGDALLKYNLAQLQNNVNKFTATTAHGTNLVTDILYYDKIIQNQLSILNTLKTILGNISSFIQFFKELNPKDLDPERKAVFYRYTIKNMESAQVKVDALQNDIESVMLSTKDVLSVS